MSMSSPRAKRSPGNSIAGVPPERLRGRSIRGFRGEGKTLLYVYVNVNHGHQGCRARAGGLRRLAPTRILRDWRSNARISERSEERRVGKECGARGCRGDER